MIVGEQYFVCSCGTHYIDKTTKLVYTRQVDEHNILPPEMKPVPPGKLPYCASEIVQGMVREAEYTQPRVLR